MTCGLLKLFSLNSKCSTGLPLILNIANRKCSDGSRGGARRGPAPPPLFLAQTEARGAKTFYFNTATPLISGSACPLPPPPPPPPPHTHTHTLIRRSGSATEMGLIMDDSQLIGSGICFISGRQLVYCEYS